MYARLEQKKYFEQLASVLPVDSRMVDIRSLRKAGRLPALEPEIVSGLGKVVDFHIKGQFSGKTSLFSSIERLYRQGPYRHFKWRQAQRLFQECVTTLSDLRPAAVAIWNGQKFYTAVAALAARHLGIQVLYFENGVLPNTTTIDPKGVNANNSVPRDPAFYRNFKDTLKDAVPVVARPPRTGKKMVSTTEELPSRYLLVPLQIDSDTQVVIHSPWIASMHQFFFEMIDASQKWQDRGLHVVFREHPSSRRNYADLHKIARSMPRIHFISDRPLQEMIERATAVVTINSSVGVEALVLGRPVITVGNAFYNIEGLVSHARNGHELIEAVNRLADTTMDEELRLRFLAYLRNDYAVPGNWKVPSAEHLNLMSARIMEWIEEEPGASTCNAS